MTFLPAGEPFELSDFYYLIDRELCYNVPYLNFVCLPLFFSNEFSSRPWLLARDAVFSWINKFLIFKFIRRY